MWIGVSSGVRVSRACITCARAQVVSCECTCVCGRVYVLVDVCGVRVRVYVYVCMCRWANGARARICTGGYITRCTRLKWFRPRWSGSPGSSVWWGRRFATDRPKDHPNPAVGDEGFPTPVVSGRERDHPPPPGTRANKQPLAPDATSTAAAQTHSCLRG